MRSKNEILDLIILFISKEERIGVDDLFHKYNAELNTLGIDEKYLEQILKELLKDNLLFLDSSAYRLTIVGKAFKGYSFAEKKNKVAIKKLTLFDKSTRIIPIILAVLFGTSTIYFNIANKKSSQELEQKNEIIKKQEKLIDSLSVLIIPKN